MTTNNNLNTAGQICLGGVAAIAVNLFGQPFCTLKNRVMTQQRPIPPGLKLLATTKFLYSGITAMIMTDISQNCLLYSSNGILNHHAFNPWVSAALAGAVTTPGITFGEGVMINQQVHKLSLINAVKKLIRTQTMANSINGLAATMLREVSYGVAVFALPKHIECFLPISHNSTKEFAAGFMAGITMGLLSTPLDIIKTRVQSNEVTLPQATKNVFTEFRTKPGQKMLVKAILGRTSNIGLAIAIMNVVNNRVPALFPDRLKKD